ncbi:Uncharacterized protein FWK35_00020735, partial [Aphis craccivora]
MTTLHFTRKMDSSERKICRYPLVAQKKHICGIQCPQNDSERSDECIDFTMIRNNAPTSNFGGGFRCKSEYPWCIIEVKSKHSSTVFKKIEKNKKKMTEKREFLRKPSFRPNRFFYMV